MELAVTLVGWQLFIALAVSLKPNPDLKLPTVDEIKQMRKEAYHRFKRAFKAMAHHH